MQIIRLELGDLKSNTYIITVNKQCFIIDPGFEADKIIDYIKSKKLVPQFIYITHGHYDHTGAVKTIKEHYHIPVYAPLKDKIWMSDSVYNHWKEPIPVDQFVVENDKIEFEGLFFEVIETPGHSEGSTSLYCAPHLFTGDALFKESIGRTDFPFGNYQQLLDSITKKLYTLPDDTICYPGHGESTTIGHEKEHNPFTK